MEADYFFGPNQKGKVDSPVSCGLRTDGSDDVSVYKGSENSVDPRELKDEFSVSRN